MVITRTVEMHAQLVEMILRKKVYPLIKILQ